MELTDSLRRDGRPGNLKQRQVPEECDPIQSLSSMDASDDAELDEPLQAGHGRQLPDAIVRDPRGNENQFGERGEAAQILHPSSVTLVL